MKKKIIISTLTILFVLPFSSGLSCSQGVGQVNKIQPVNLVEKSINFNIVKEEKEKNYMIMRASAYTKSIEEDTYKGITKSGTIVCRGIVSTDPRVIPLGTKLHIEGYGEATALDVGGAIKGNKIDIYMETKKEAMEFGKRDVKVFILD